MLVGFAVLVLIFIAWQVYRGDAALIPITLLADRSILLSLIFAFLFMGSFVIAVYYLPEWFQIVEGASPIRSGVMLLPSVCTQVFGAIVSSVTGMFPLALMHSALTINRQPNMYDITIPGSSLAQACYVLPLVSTQPLAPSPHQPANG